MSMFLLHSCALVKYVLQCVCSVSCGTACIAASFRVRAFKFSYMLIPNLVFLFALAHVFVHVKTHQSPQGVTSEF